MVKEQAFDSGTEQINYVEGPPSGRPLVMLHGVSLRWQDFLTVIPTLAWRFQVYALDFRGHGRSGRVQEKYRIADYADDTIAFLRNRVAEPVDLLGHSLGAMVAIEVAVRAPDAVRSVLLVDPPLYNHGPRLKQHPSYSTFIALRDLARSAHSVEEMASALAEISPEQDAAACRSRAGSLCSIDPDVLTFVIDDRLYDGYDTDSLLQGISSPVLLLRGDPGLGGRMLDEDRRAESMIAHGTLVDVPEAGHAIHKQNPQAFSRAVTDFLETV